MRGEWRVHSEWSWLHEVGGGRTGSGPPPQLLQAIRVENRPWWLQARCGIRIRDAMEDRWNPAKITPCLGRLSFQITIRGTTATSQNQRKFLYSSAVAELLSLA